jgi:hypothetical protein
MHVIFIFPPPTHQLKPLLSFIQAVFNYMSSKKKLLEHYFLFSSHSLIDISFKLNSYILSQKSIPKPGLVVYACNPSYSGVRDQEDYCLKSAPGK